MKKNNFNKIFIVFSLCVFLLSLFSISSFALNISDVHSGYLYKFKGALPVSSLPSQTSLDVKGYLVNMSSGDMTPFDSLTYGYLGSNASRYYFLTADTGDTGPEVVSGSSVFYYLYIDYSVNTISKESVESVFSKYFDYSVSTFQVSSMFNKVNIALSGGTNSEGVSYDGFLGMISKFGKFLVSSPLLLVLCIALPLVSFSVGLIIRIKNRA